MAWKTLVAAVALGAGLSLGVAGSARAEHSMADMLTVQQEVQNKVNDEISTASQIEVMVDQDGVASLSGFVTSEAEEDLVVQAAKKTPGVTDVEEDLREVPGTP